MKQLILTLSLLVSIASFSQHYVRIIEYGGKYGYTPSNEYDEEEIILIPFEYDTLFSPGGAKTYDFLVGFKGDEVDILYVSVYDDKLLGQVDTLGINHVFYHNSREFYGLVATNADGEAYYVEEDYAKLKKDIPIIYRKDDNKYYLSRKGKDFTKSGYNFIEQVMSVYACYTHDGIVFLDEEGKEIYGETVSTYETRWDARGTIFVYKGDQRGYFKTDGSKKLPLTKIKTPERFLASDEYGNNTRYPIFQYAAVGEKGAMGLIDARGKEIWPKEYEEVVVAYHDTEYFTVLRKGKKSWEIFDGSLEVISTIEFDQYLGSFEDKAFVKVKKDIVGLDLVNGELVNEDFIDDDFEYSVYLSPDNLVGAVDKEFNEIFPATYLDGSSYLSDVVIASTDSGKIALDLNGELLCPYSFDNIWKFEKTDSAYCYEKGKHWGTFTSNNAGGFDPTDMNGWWEFNIDVDAHTHFADHFIFREGKRKGIMDKDGKVVLAATFDEIYHEHIYKGWDGDIEDMYLGVQRGKFFVFAPKFVEFKQVTADAFIEFTDDNEYVFLRGGQLITYRHKSLLSETFKGDEKYPASEITNFMDKRSQRLKGVVTNTGKLILPIEYQSVQIKQYGDDENRYYIVAVDTNGMRSFYNIKGEQILPAEYDAIHGVCVKYNYVLKIKKADEEGAYIGVWDASTNKITALTEKNVKSVTCGSYKRNKVDYMAEITYLDGSKAKLMDDLSIVPFE